MKKTLMTLAALVLSIGMYAQKTVSTATTWEWNEYPNNNEVIANGIIESNGLYIRGGKDTHEIKTRMLKKKATLKDGTEYKARMGLYQNGNPFWKLVKPNTKADNPNPSLDRCYALQTEKAGTLTVLIKPKEGVEDRYAKIVFNGQEVASADLEEPDFVELSYTADKGGTFYFGADCIYFMYFAKFVPAE